MSEKRKNSNSEQSLYIHSEEEEEIEEEKVSEQGDGYSSDSSEATSSTHNRPGSYNTSWPRSYRQSMDMYSGVQSPNVGFLGTPSLSKISGSFLSSSLTRRHSPEVIKPLLPVVTDDQAEQQQLHSSHSLLPPLPTRRSYAKKTITEDAPPKVSHEIQLPRQCSYGQAVLNGINVLCGVGILSTPYAVSQGGWIGLSILFVFAALSWYTGILLRYCLDSLPGLETYPDIGQAAFGTVGRFVISIILYVELYACCVEYIILESDNLSSLFPNAHLSFKGYMLVSHHLFAFMVTLVILPTVWLRDLSILSYISAGGVIASVLVVCCLFWVGFIDQVGFESKEIALNIPTLPVAIGLYGYCYSGHAVFPNIYTSMAKPNQYPSVLLTSFGIVTLLYVGVATVGYSVFGNTTLSQFTLSMPQDLVASKIALWTTVVNPFTKYALIMSPVALSLEELIPSNQMKSHMYAILIRTTLVISTLIVALCIPFFGLLMALIGSLFTMLVTLIFPCACFLSILRGKVTRFQGFLCILIITIGIVSSIIGTISAFSKIIQNLS